MHNFANENYYRNKSNELYNNCKFKEYDERDKFWWIRSSRNVVEKVITIDTLLNKFERKFRITILT
jgi:hypothetical protein